MTRTVENVVEDIYRVVEEGTQVNEELTRKFAEDLADIVSTRLSSDRSREYTLRMSNLGEKCDRKSWFEARHPELGEPLSGQTLLKFLLGDIIEALLLHLTRVAGHTVSGEQDEVDLYGVLGHRDGVIDGHLVDVKSASTRAMFKFEEGLTPENDSFGYMTQLMGYLEAGQDDDTLTDKDRASFLAMDKTLAKLVLDTHHKDEISLDFKELVEHKRAVINSEEMPERGYEDEPDGKSGNRKLGVACSYCAYRFSCWPGLRVYNYSGKPRHLTVVKREPKVKEIDEPF